jgi:hypothetical protein
MRPSSARLANMLLGVLAAFALSTTTACVEGDDGDDADEAAADALTVEHGDAFVDSVTDDHVVLRKSARGQTLKFKAADFQGKSVLIHPIPGKTETGVYAHVESIDDQGTTLSLGVRPLDFEEMEATRGTDVIRLYRDRSLPVATGTPSPQDGTFLLAPPEAGGGGLVPLGVTGPLAGDLNPTIWVGRGQVSVGGTMETRVESAHLDFAPRAVLEYQRGKGIVVGVRGTFAADIAMSFRGNVGGSVTLFKSPKISSPRVTFLVPVGVPPAVAPVPVRIGVDTSVSCSSSGKIDVDGVFDGHVSVTTSASAALHPSRHKPIDQWLQAGPWASTVKADVSFDARPGARVTGTSGISCTIPRIGFPITVAGLIGPYVAIKPSVGLTQAGLTPSVGVYAGAVSELADGPFFEMPLVKWTPN